MGLKARTAFPFALLKENRPARTLPPARRLVKVSCRRLLNEAIAMTLRSGLLFAAVALAALALPTATAAAPERALLLDIDGAIGPPIAEYVVRELGAAKPG